MMSWIVVYAIPKYDPFTVVRVRNILESKIIS